MTQEQALDVSEAALAYHILWRAWSHILKSPNYTAAADTVLSTAKDDVISSIDPSDMSIIQKTLFAVYDWNKEHTA